MNLGNKAEKATQNMEGKVIQADRIARGEILSQGCTWSLKKAVKCPGLV